MRASCVVKCLRAHGGLSRHQEPMKDVGDRDRPRGVVNRAVIEDVRMGNPAPG